MKFNLKNICKIISILISVTFVACTPPNTVNVTEENKSFSIKATSEIKVPRLPETYNNGNYYSKTITSRLSAINQVCTNCFNGSIQPAFIGSGSYEGIGIIIGSLSATGVSVVFGSNSLPTNKFELNKVYSLGLGANSQIIITNVGFPLESGNTTLVFQKISESQVKLVIQMTGLKTQAYTYNANTSSAYTRYFAMESASVEVNITVPNDTLKLNIPNNTIGKNASATNLVVDTSSTSRKWIMEITGDGFTKTYTGTNDVTHVFPDGINVKSLKDGEYVVQLYYEDQPSEILTQTITVDNGEDKVCSTKYTASGVPYESCFSCPEGMNIVFVNGVPAQCEPNGEVSAGVYVKNENQYYPFGNNGAFRINSFSENYCTSATQESN